MRLGAKVALMDRNDTGNLVECLVGYLLPLISSGQLKPEASPEMQISHMGAIITDAIFLSD